MRIHILRRGRRGRAKGDQRSARVWDRVRRRDQTNTFRLSLSLLLWLSLSFHLLDSPFLSFSLHHHRPRRRGFSFPFSVAPELWQTRYQFLTFARKRAFLSLSPSFFPPRRQRRSRHRFSLVGLVLCLLPSPFARQGGAAGRRRRRDSIIIADSLISINCRAHGFPMDSARLKRQPLLKLILYLRNLTARANLWILKRMWLREH